MADWGSATIDRLLEAEAFVAAVGDRVDWTSSPTGTAHPRVVLTTVSDPRPDHYGGEEGFRETRLQLDVYSTDSAADANEIAELAISVLKPEAVKSGIRFDRAGVEGPTDSGDRTETEYIYRSRVDFLLWHAKTDDDDTPIGNGPPVWSEVEW